MILEQVHRWSAESPEWDLVQEFVDAIRLEATQKQVERDDKIRVKLERSLERLIEHYTSDLAFFEYSAKDLSEWQATGCPLELASKAITMVNDLFERLAQRQMEEQAPATNIQEARERRAKLEATENRILSLASELRDTLSITEPIQTRTSESTSDDLPQSKGADPSSPMPSSNDSLSESKAPAVVDEKAEATGVDAAADPSAPSTSDDDDQSSRASDEPQAPGSFSSSVVAVARTLLTDDSEERWFALTWSLLADGDWSAAYWLTHSRVESGAAAPVAPPVLAVLQASRWLESDADPAASEIARIVSDTELRDVNADRLIAMAAALWPSLVAPNTGLIAWLPPKDKVPHALGDIAETVRAFASYGHPISADDISQIEGEVNLEQRTDEIEQRARALLEGMERRKLKIRRATNVLRYMASERGDVRGVLDPIVTGQRNEVERVEKQLETLASRQELVSRITQIERDVLKHSKAAPPITGEALEQLVRSAGEVVDIGRSWCSRVRLTQRIKRGGDWWPGLVEALRDSFRAVATHARTELFEAGSAGGLLEYPVIAGVLEQSMSRIESFLGVSTEAGAQGSLDTRAEWMTRGPRSVSDSISRRLLLVPEVTLEDNGQPVESEIAGIAERLVQSLSDNPDRSIRRAFERRWARQDYRFVDAVGDEYIDNAPDDKWRDQYMVALENARAILFQRIERAEESIEQATVDGLLLEAEREEFVGALSNISVETSLNLGPLLDRVNAIQQQLEARRNDHIKALETSWSDIRANLEGTLQDKRLIVVDRFVRRAIEQRDTRVMEETIARLREFIDGDTIDAWFDPPPKRDVFVEFCGVLPQIEATLLKDDSGGLDQFIESSVRSTIAGLKTLSNAAKDDANTVAEAWRILKHRTEDDVADRVKDVLLFLGFPEAVRVTLASKTRELTRFRADVPSGRDDTTDYTFAKPIPQLGSLARGRYDVVCVSDQDGTNIIGRLVRETDLRSDLAIVLILGPLSADRRRDLAVRSRTRKLTTIVVDEALVAYLMQIEDIRFFTFLCCTLPYTVINPYTPFQAGGVPPEVFFGRQDMVSAIQQQNEGSCIIFGGRQLGKSALLTQVQREFHRPDRERFAWVEDIKTIGDPLTGERPDIVWVRLRDGFKAMGLLREHVRANEPRNIISHIEGAMDSVPERRVVVLFDEADHFLDADSHESFPVLEGLRRLIQTTKLRFKVVFAGLHNVQRFKNIPNQPLAHFGQNLLVGPLEAEAARRLVIDPMETLGYRYADESAVLKVLSYTNYHPGLIQYFCRELLNRLQKRARSERPPFTISAAEVEAVYRLERTREIIRERLDWTLALDRRYQCLAWSMIYEQGGGRDSYSRAFSVSELFQLAKRNWPLGFEGTDTERVSGLLGEMVGLGILVRNSDNQFLLRSPNLVRLMGTEDDIEIRLVELSEVPKPARSQPESQHYLLQGDGESPLYSPLTLVQEGQLESAQQSGVTLVFGSDALGLDVLSQALKRVCGGQSKAIPADQSIQAGRMVAWLERYAARRQRTERQLTYGWLNGDGEQMARCVASVLDMCRGFNRKKRRPLQVVFVMNVDATRAWMGLSEHERKNLEDRADTLCLRRWDEVGIQQRLSSAEKLDIPEVCESVLRATGGWPSVLNEFLLRCGADLDPRRHAEALVADTSGAASKLGERLLVESGVGPRDGLEGRVLRAIVEYDGIAEDDIGSLPSLIDRNLPTHDCGAALGYLERIGCVERREGRFQPEAVLSRIVVSN